MKLSEMANEQKNRWIAEKLEPFESLPALRDEEWSGVGSPLCAWAGISDYGEGDIPKWVPRNFIADPAMTVMLLEKLREKHAEIRLDADYVGMTIGRNGDNYWQASSNITVGQAVADAWMLSMGYPEEG